MRVDSSGDVLRDPVVMVGRDGVAGDSGRSCTRASHPTPTVGRLVRSGQHVVLPSPSKVGPGSGGGVWPADGQTLRGKQDT